MQLPSSKICSSIDAVAQAKVEDAIFEMYFLTVDIAEAVRH